MALNPNPVGKAIADYFMANAPAPGHVATPLEVETLWQGAINILYNDIKATMDVLPTSHGGPNLNDPAGQTVVIPSTATPTNPSTGSVTTPSDIAGKGSVV